MPRFKMNAIRTLAFYLPQFHPIPENDDWWGAGFTEWTNTAKARPLYEGHAQPNLPGELSFYDLRLAETREAQARLAQTYGVDGFCYYRYWFAGKELLERPLAEVIATGAPSFPLCVWWANQSWTGVWHGVPNRILIEQTYPEGDDRRHFDALIPLFRDPRYIRVNGKPLFGVTRPTELPDARAFTDAWRRMAAEHGLPGLYLVCNVDDHEYDAAASGFDAAVITRIVPKDIPFPSRAERFRRRLRSWRGLPNLPAIVPYVETVAALIPPIEPGSVYHPCIVPNWDNTPRSAERGWVFEGSTPERFRKHAEQAVRRVRASPGDEPLLFVKSWNEWAEGNYLEPDRRYGRAYLEALRAALGTGGD